MNVRPQNIRMPFGCLLRSRKNEMTTTTKIRKRKKKFHLLGQMVNENSTRVPKENACNTTITKMLCGNSTDWYTNTHTCKYARIINALLCWGMQPKQT